MITSTYVMQKSKNLHLPLVHHAKVCFEKLLEVALADLHVLWTFHFSYLWTWNIESSTMSWTLWLPLGYWYQITMLLQCKWGFFWKLPRTKKIDFQHWCFSSCHLVHSFCSQRFWECTWQAQENSTSTLYVLCWNQ